MKPDCVILDEFHRAGAEQWGLAVQRLLMIYGDKKLLGFTATNIRYLDRQRDMADELFENNVASRMTLGEAIVLGILNPPKYVLSIFSYQKDLERYKRRIQRANNKEVQSVAQEYFEALRRKLENAEGLNLMFEKHMSAPHGKYLVFCSNAEHMDEMIRKVPDWFSGLDKAPHIYRAYADDPKTAQAFADFKKDESEHLKLLFCIDMLNEGVHVDDVNGVILLRPTVSPIIYKQQIGRALSANKKNDAGIFDVVLNAENLYSISSIQEEMRAAITYYHYLGEYRNIVNERFEVIDETRDCMQLFAALEHSLDASWDLMFAEARKYYTEHGNLLIPARYRTANGQSLGGWLNLQRMIYSGKRQGLLTDEQIERLNSIGVVWDDYKDVSWERNYLIAKDYYEKNGDLMVPTKYVTEDGFPLGMWIMSMRQAQRNKRNGVLTEKRIKRLSDIGMSWDAISDQWEKNYQEAANYYQEHGNLLVPQRYISASGLKLGYWISHLRRDRSQNSDTLSEEQIERLNRIGMAWNADEERWQIGCQEARRYRKEHGNLNVPSRYKTETGYQLGLWLNLKRRQYKSGTLTDAQIHELEALGIRWSVSADHWDEMLQAARSYYAEHGDLQVPRKTVFTDNGQDLGSWITRQRMNREKLAKEQREALSSVGMDWGKQSTGRKNRKP